MIVTSDSARIHVDVHGRRDATADVLLLHAGVTDRRSWHPVIDRLGPSYRCIAPDRRGYGETTYVTDDGWSSVDDDVAVLDALDVDRAVVVGCSLGGRAAIDLALEHPARVEALVLIGSALHGGPPVQHTPELQEVEDREAAAEERGDLDAINRIEAHYWLDGLGHEGRVGGEARRLFLDMNRRALELDRQRPTGDEARLTQADDLGDIHAPTLVIVGNLDFPHVIATATMLAERVPDATLVRLPERAHLPHLEADATCLSAIEDFVAGATSG